MTVTGSEVWLLLDLKLISVEAQIASLFYY